ncbi:MAG: acyl-CoA thioesterase [Alphaproteobacteria bacterium]|nr:acyl-CoA thioesterase [Alphaproteobacteria bacterium]
MPGQAMTSTRTVQWGDSDPAGRINSPRAYDYAVEVVEAFFRAELGLCYRELIHDRGLGFPVVSSACDFISMLQEGDEVKLTATVERVSRSTVTWKVEAHHAVTSALAFTVRMTSCFISNASGRAIPIPAEWRGKFEEYAAVEV